MNYNFQQAVNTIMPFLVRADLKEYATGSFIYNPFGGEKLLKKIADDLAGTFIFTNEGELVVAGKELIDALKTSPEELAAIAEQNITKLFQSHQVLKKDIAVNSTVYSLLLNSRNEASCMLATKIWDAISARHNDYIVVAAPRFNEINYCTLKGNALPHLIDYAMATYNASGKAALSPNIYLHHNAEWVMFEHGYEQIAEYCVAHGL